MNDIGVNFAPTFAGAEQARQQGAQAQPQGALRTLSFRLPQVTGSASKNSLSPLVTNAPAGGFGGAVLQSVLRTILGSDALSAFGGGQQPQQQPSSPVLRTRDYGSDFLQSVRSAPPPQTGPSDNVNVPQFDGNFDALPGSSNASTAPNTPAFDDYGGGGLPGQPNAWEQLTMGNDQPMPSYMSGFQPWVPQRPPNPGFIVDQNPTGGGNRA